MDVYNVGVGGAEAEDVDLGLGDGLCVGLGGGGVYMYKDRCVYVQCSHLLFVGLDGRGLEAVLAASVVASSV